MNNPISIAAKRCLSVKKRLQNAEWTCDYCSDSYKNHRKCYHKVAKELMQNMHDCLIA